jgi:hypothetical protein
MSPVSFAEFSKNPISAVAFIMLGVVGFLYYDSENTKKELIQNCKKENEVLAAKVETMQKNMKRSDSLVAVYKYECDIYLLAMENDSTIITNLMKKNEKDFGNF